MSLTELQIHKLVEKYIREQDRFEKMAEIVSRYLSARLRALAMPHMVTFRSKSPDSLRGKLTKNKGKHAFTLFDGEFTPAILDLAGVRILLYRPQDIEPACREIESLFALPEGQRYRRDHEHTEGYQARHRVVALRDEMMEGDPRLSNLQGVHCEVQVVTLANHIWNELEHDIVYKTPTGQPSSEQTGLLQTLRDQMTVIEKSVARLMEATERQRASNLASIESPQDLQQALKVRCARTIKGDFERLLELLVGAMSDVTPANLAKLPLSGNDLDAAVMKAANLEGGNMKGDEVEAVIVALWDMFGKEFVDIVDHWRGPRNRIRRLVHALNDATESGTL